MGGYGGQRLPREVRARIGYLAEGHPVFGWMRVRDAHAYQSKFYPKWNKGLFNSVLEFFRVDPKTVTRWAKAGKLTSIRTLGGHRRYRETEVRALLAGIPQPRSE